MSTKGYFDLGENKTITVRCAGNLTVKGDVGATVRYSAEDGSSSAQSDAENCIVSQGNLRVQLPKGVSLVVASVGGNALIKGVQGGVAFEGNISGNLTVKSVEGDVTFQLIRGNARFTNISGGVYIKGVVHGSLFAKHVEAIHATQISGNLSAKHISGDVYAQTVHGNVGIRYVTGDVTLADISGDVVLADIGGLIDVNCQDDIRCSGTLVAGKHKLIAASTIDFRYPSGSPLTISAESDQIEVRFKFDTLLKTDDGKTEASLGTGGPMVMLAAPERLRIRPSSPDSDSFSDTDVDFNFDFGEIGERISAELNTHINDFSTRIGPEIGLKAEKAFRKAQEAIDRAVNKMEAEITRAEQRMQAKPAQKHRSSHGGPSARPAAPVPPQAPKVDTTQAQLKILKMLEEGKVTVDEANKLLATLG